MSAAYLEALLTFSATERVVEAGGRWELPVPLTDSDGCFLLFQYAEKGGEMIRFTVKTDSGRMLLDETRAQSSGRLHVAQASRLTLSWDNSNAWLNSVSVGYNVRIVSDRGVEHTLRLRLLHAARNGQDVLTKECLDRGVPVDSTDEAGYTALMLAVLGRQQLTAELLLQRGASLAAHDRRGNSPLHLASLQQESGASHARCACPLAHKRTYHTGALVRAQGRCGCYSKPRRMGWRRTMT